MRKINLTYVFLGVLSALIVMTDLAMGECLFTMDAASFQQKSGLVYQEIYFMIQRDKLKFMQTANGFEAQYRISVDLSSSDTLLSTTSWEMVDRVQKLEDITSRQKLPDLVVYNLGPGKYRVKATVTDLNRDMSDEGSLELQLDAFPVDELALSDIELATKIQKGEEDSKFYKNGFLVIPNPERIFGTSLPMLYYYAEVYNLLAGEGEFSVERIILDDAKKPVVQLPQKVRKKVGPSVVELDAFSVASLSSGTYYLQLAATDEDTKQSASSQVKFFVYRSEDFREKALDLTVAGDVDLELEINSYDREELSEAVDELKYFLSEPDWRTVGGLSDDGKRNFLIQFYRQRDPNPATPVNEFRLALVQRKEYSDQKFSQWDRAGWKTDRGRVYVLYGPPDDIEYHTHDPATRSYQVWYYDNIEGGVQFVFVDRNNFGDYILVHSNKQGELYRPNWFEEEALIRRP